MIKKPSPKKHIDRENKMIILHSKSKEKSSSGDEKRS